VNQRSTLVTLLHREILHEWRNKYAISGILLYLAGIVVLISFGFEEVDDRVWMVLFWIAVLFTSVNAVAKSFLQESSGLQMYMYSIASPQLIILSRMIYNTILMVVLSVIALALYAFSLGFPVTGVSSFLLVMLMGAVAFALTFTMISAIAGSGRNAGTLTAILAFPILLPVLRILIRVSLESLVADDLSANLQDLLYLLALNAFIAVLALVLFPYLWRD
jgi:heme exporter protein B